MCRNKQRIMAEDQLVDIVGWIDGGGIQAWSRAEQGPGVGRELKARESSWFPGKQKRISRDWEAETGAGGGTSMEPAASWWTGWMLMLKDGA